MPTKACFHTETDHASHLKLRADSWKDIFDDTLHSDKSDCRALFDHPNADADFYSAAYLKHRRRFKRKINQVTAGHRNLILCNSGSVKSQSRLYYWLAGRKWVNTICETGFNAGHSTLQWLAGSNHTKVYSFDIGIYNYTRPMANFLKQTFPGRLQLIMGNSLESVPRFSMNNPDVECDVIVVDGGHTVDVALGDLQNLRAMANMQHHVLVLDDLPSGIDPFLVHIGYAWNKMRADGHIVERYACTEQPNKMKGFVIGYYI